MQAPSGNIYRFGPFAVNSSTGELLKMGKRVKIQDQPVRLLLVLLENAGEVVTRKEIQSRIWEENTFVDFDSSLRVAVGKLRESLGDETGNPHYIETVPRRGYRLIANVTVEAQPGAAAETPIESATNASAAIASPAMAPEDRDPAVQIHRAHKLFYYVAGIAVLVAAVAAAYSLRRRPPPVPAESSEWEQLTFFTDSAVYPALSPDGRMLAFIRGSNSFFGQGQVYVKTLPAGEPVQLTNDAVLKMAPSFSRDGSNVVYSTVDPWEIWEVPVLRGAPHLLLTNSSSMTWIEEGKRLLFSELRGRLHLVLVTTTEDRGDVRDVYVPPGDRSMAHHSYLSPDGRWVLIVEMDSESRMMPCGIVSFPAAGVAPASQATRVGPANLECLAASWSPDGKWIYLAVGDRTTGTGRSGALLASGSHIWRQRFPDGKPEQLTFGPTSQEGLAMAADGRSFITSVGSQDRTVWMQDKNGEHQISSEGSASSPAFSFDGRSLYFLMSNGQTKGEELWRRDLGSGQVDRVLPGYPMLEYSVSRDGSEVAFTTADRGGRSNIWTAPVSRGSAPVRISSAAAEDAPLFLPDGDIAFRATEDGGNFLYRMKADGSGRRRISAERLLDVYSVSPDGRWVIAESPGTGTRDDLNPGATKAFAVDGSAAVTLCVGYCVAQWDTSGAFLYFHFPTLKEGSYALAAMRDSGLPRIPASGDSREDMTKEKATIAIDESVESAVSPSQYAYTRVNTRRNLYRIPLR